MIIHRIKKGIQCYPIGNIKKNIIKNDHRFYAKSIYRTGLKPLTYGTRQEGELGQLEYRKFLLNENGENISYWHDVPLYAGVSFVGDRLLNFVNEIPKGTRAKMEMSKEEMYNPIKQDTKNGELRFIKYSPVLFNYGFLPQTWESPDLLDGETGLPGDNDPIDIIDIGFKRKEIGEVYRVKILGAIGLIDEGEMDWKILSISLDDPKVRDIHTIDDIRKHKTGALESITHFYQNYKTKDGKDKNIIAYDGKIHEKDFAFDIISKTHEEWKKIQDNESLSKKFFFIKK